MGSNGITIYFNFFFYLLFFKVINLQIIFFYIVRNLCIIKKYNLVLLNTYKYI
jgi:hypothetical protein